MTTDLTPFAAAISMVASVTLGVLVVERAQALLTWARVRVRRDGRR